MKTDILQAGFCMFIITKQEQSLKFIWIEHLITDEEPLYFWQAQVRECFRISFELFLTFNITPARVKFFVKNDKHLPVSWMLLLEFCSTELECL